jgi:hypothetical protein
MRSCYSGKKHLAMLCRQAWEESCSRLAFLRSISSRTSNTRCYHRPVKKACFLKQQI